MTTAESVDHAYLSPEKRAELQIETEKLKIERLKAWGAVLSIPVSFLVAALTILYGIWSQDVRERADFEIKATEIVMNATSPIAAANKAEALTILFPNRLPPHFATALSDLSSYEVKRTKDLPRRSSSQ